MTRTRSGTLLLLLGAGVPAGCVHVKVDPVEVKPIHIVADINIKVDRELDDFFAFEDKYAPTRAPATSQPTTTSVQEISSAVAAR